MNRQFFYSTMLAGVMGLSTLVLFHNGAEALDLSDFTGADQKVITQDAPKAGGIVLVKQDVVYPAPKVRVMTAQPMLTGAAGVTDYNAIAPAAGGKSIVAGYRAGDGSTGVPGKGIDNKLDITTMPGNSFDRVQARFQAGGPSVPPDGKPNTTTTLANGARVNDLAEIAPAAGGPLPTIRSNRASSSQSLRAMTGRGGSYYNN